MIVMMIIMLIFNMMMMMTENKNVCGLYELLASTLIYSTEKNDQDDDDYDDVQDANNDISSIGNRIRMCLSHWWANQTQKKLERKNL